MHPLYPAIKPYKCHELAVSAPHILYLEETGNPQGLPVIILHPGPGAGSEAYLRRFFDPQVYRIILFDQRGCGLSSPQVETTNNNTQDLLDDIDAIRDYLGLSRFVLFGGGWGSLLALLYAQLYPHQISALLLQGLFLGRAAEMNWLYQSGASLIYPDYWQEFINLVPPENQHQILHYYIQCLQSDNELARMAAAKSWVLWKARCSSLQPHFAMIEHCHSPHYALTVATLESYFIANHYFIEENQVINKAHKIRHIPTWLVHGRYDMISPLQNAWELHQALASSSLRIVRDAGHSDREPGIIDALITTSKEISQQDLDVC